MPIFRRDADTPPEASPSDPPGAGPRRFDLRGSAGPASAARGAAPAVTHIVAGSRVVGEISGGAGVRIDGELEGRVVIDHTVLVGPQGKVQGSLEAGSIEVGGRVEGNLRGREKVEITPTGSLEGDISAPRVVIAEGAFFKGQVEMGGDDSSGSSGSTGRGRA
jgi:cytoskeletal protein CcmA (bactofilin family)